MTKRTARVLILGLAPRHFDDFRRLVQVSMHQDDPELMLNATPCKSFAEVVDQIRHTPQLDVVYITNELERAMSDMIVGAGELARALARHTNRPVVVLSFTLDYLVPVIESEGVDAVIRVALARAIVYRHRKVAVKATA